MILYDITNKNSFENVNKWIINIKNKKNKKGKIILIGNKNDLKNERIISFEEGKKLANKYNIYFNETSGKTGKNIMEVFYFLTLEIYIQLISSLK